MKAREKAYPSLAPRLSSVSVDTLMPTHMPLNKLQQYGGSHGLFHTSAEHLQADQAVPKNHNTVFHEGSWQPPSDQTFQ